MDFTAETRDVWVLDLSDHTLSRATFQNSGHDPTWLPDGKDLLYAEIRGPHTGIVRAPVDGSRPADSVYFEGVQITVHAVTPDGRTGIAVVFPNTGGSDIVAVPLSGGGKPKPLAATPYDEGYPALSPDGRWLAYVSNEANRSDVYLRALDGTAGKLLVSQDGGSEPVWSRDGRKLFYRSLGPGSATAGRSADRDHALAPGGVAHAALCRDGFRAGGPARELRRDAGWEELRHGAAGRALAVRVSAALDRAAGATGSGALRLRDSGIRNA